MQSTATLNTAPKNDIIINRYEKFNKWNNSYDSDGNSIKGSDDEKSEKKPPKPSNAPPKPTNTPSQKNKPNNDRMERRNQRKQQNQQNQQNHEGEQNRYETEEEYNKRQTKNNVKHVAHKYKHGDILFYGTVTVIINTLVSEGSSLIPLYRIYKIDTKMNIPANKLYKLVNDVNPYDMNQRRYEKYDENNNLKFKDIVYCGNLDFPLKMTLSEEHHFQWRIYRINDDGTFNLERRDNNDLKFVLENELSDTPQ